MIHIRKYQPDDTEQMRHIWNQVVEEGVSFPQEEFLTAAEATTFFAEQTYTAVAEQEGTVVGLYILHPNNVGRCSHIANTSYAVEANARGQKIGEQLVKDSIIQAATHQFQLLQFNAVVATNTAAIALYNKLGFTQLAAIPNGFRLKDGRFTDIYPFYLEL